MSIQELDRVIDEILSRAEREKEKIIQEARRKASEILSRPVPVELYRAEAEELIKRAKLDAERIIREAEDRSREIKYTASRRLDQAVDHLVKLVAGLER